MANAARLALAVMAHNLGRAVALLAGPELARATATTLRRRIFTMPSRLIHTGRRRTPATTRILAVGRPDPAGTYPHPAIPLRC